MLLLSSAVEPRAERIVRGMRSGKVRYQVGIGSRHERYSRIVTSTASTAAGKMRTRHRLIRSAVMRFPRSNCVICHHPHAQGNRSVPARGQTVTVLLKK